MIGALKAKYAGQMDFGKASGYGEGGAVVVISPRPDYGAAQEP